MEMRHIQEDRPTLVLHLQLQQPSHMHGNILFGVCELNKSRNLDTTW